MNATRLVRAVSFLLGFLSSTPVWAQAQGYLELKIEYDAAMKSYQEAIARAGRDGSPPPGRFEPAFLDRFVDLAERDPDSEDGVQAAAWICSRLTFAQPDETRRLELGRRYLGRLAQRHPSHPAVRDMVRGVGFGGAASYGSEGAEALRTILRAPGQRDSTSAETLVALALCRAGPRTNPTEAERSEAKEALARCVRDFPTLDASRHAGPMLFELEHLQVGCVAPDFESTDLEGEAVRLSDYRGRILVLVFWDSRSSSVLGRLAELREDHGDSVAILGICPARAREACEGLADRAGIEWANVCDEESRIARQWNMHASLTIYVLDDRGVIQGRKLDPSNLGALVGRLLEERRRGH